jgi:tetratricopeptide (TPR) repeat protein
MLMHANRSMLVRLLATFGPVVTLGLATLGLLASVPAHAQPTIDMAVCARTTVPPVSYQASLAACTRAIDARDNRAGRIVALHNRCAIFIALGEHERALQDCDEAILLNPDYASAYNNRGAAQSALGANERALQDYDRALRLDPANAIAYNGRCYSLAVLGRAAEALTSCERSLQLRPNDVNALDSRGYAYLRLERWAEARRDYDAAIARDAGNAISWFARAIVRARQGDQAGAQTDLATARSLRPTIDADAARAHLTAPSFEAPAQP